MVGEMRDQATQNRVPCAVEVLVARQPRFTRAPTEGEQSDLGSAIDLRQLDNDIRLLVSDLGKARR